LDHSGTNNGSGPSWGFIDRQRDRKQPLLVEYADLHYLGRLGEGFTVPPPQALVNCTQWGYGYVYGFRVPLIVVSAYAKATYIPHQTHDFASLSEVH